MDINLVLLKKNGDRKVFTMPSSVTVVGRRRDCDLRIPLPSVSKRHCQLVHSGGVLRIRDLGSRNGTTHNGNAIDEAVLAAGDYIEIGPIKFILQIDGKPANAGEPELVAEVFGAKSPPVISKDEGNSDNFRKGQGLSVDDEPLDDEGETKLSEEFPDLDDMGFDGFDGLEIL